MRSTVVRQLVVWPIAVVCVVAAFGVGTAVGHHDRATATATTPTSTTSAGSAATRAATTSAAAPPTATTAPVAVSPDGIPAAEHPTGPQPSELDLAATWVPPTDMPTTGRLLQVEIPGTASHFPARPGLLYLPPAALTADPPALPVTILLSGQSRGAGPADVQNGGHIEQTLDHLAALHDGLTPIVVVPDQLTDGSHNPMCVDGPLGNSATYLEQDVPAWITSHLRVQTAASRWTIGGFSQGGTCSIQLGAGDPTRFGDLIDVSGEQGPILDSVSQTIAQGFRGDRPAYEAAQPAALLRAHTPYRDSGAYFAAGALDHRYGPVMPGMASLARSAGMQVVAWTIPGGRHSWVTASQGLAAGLVWTMPRLGLSAS